MKGADLALPFGPENAQGTRMPGKNANPSSQLVTQGLAGYKALPTINSVDSEQKQLSGELSWD